VVASMAAAEATLRRFQAPAQAVRPAAPKVTLPVAPLAKGDETDEDTPPWPDDDREEAIRAELAARDDAPAGGRSRAVSSARAATVDDRPLPALEAVRGVVPAELETLLDELFRLKLDQVWRVPTEALKQTTTAERAELTDDAEPAEPVAEDEDD